ncbi:phage portal protein, partial [Endozoicomonas sp. ONNA1]|uniref:phage portal protein n=1 Tax=Endozoicomonas sp. ONNA1 TaxID=2828740 RepID=UPI002148AB66
MGLLTNLFRRFKNSAYTAAGMGRRAKSWYAPGLSPNTALTADLSKLINRSRAAIRNDPWASSGLEKLVSNVVGRGITPKSLLDDDGLREQLQNLFLQWSDESDADG